MFEPWNDPTYLTRIWCIYEIYTAQDIGCPVTIIMPQREKEVLVDELLDGLDRLYDALSKTKIQNAKAKYEDDRQAILQNHRAISRKQCFEQCSESLPAIMGQKCHR